MTDTTTTKPTTKRPRKMAREPKAEGQGAASPDAATLSTATDAATKPQPQATAFKPPSKVNLVLMMLARPEGATIDQLVTTTGWLPHTTRAALTGLKKKGHTITSEKLGDGARVYRVTVTVTASITPAKADA